MSMSMTMTMSMTMYPDQVQCMVGASAPRPRLVSDSVTYESETGRVTHST